MVDFRKFVPAWNRVSGLLCKIVPTVAMVSTDGLDAPKARNLRLVGWAGDLQQLKVAILCHRLLH